MEREEIDVVRKSFLQFFPRLTRINSFRYKKDEWDLKGGKNERGEMLGVEL
jgi:hypothetical protein